MTDYTTSTPRTSTPGDIYGLLGVGTNNRGQLLDPSSLGGVATITLTAPTGFSVAGSPLTGSGTLALSFAAGYALPTTTKQTQWDTAYGWGDHALAGYLDAADIGSAVLAYDANLQAFTTAFTLPTADGTVGQVLMTDGAGNITFVSPATGTVTSVGLSVPTGFAVSGSPVTGSGTLALAFDTGYSLPTTASQTNWNTAFGWGNHATAGYLLASTASTIYQPLDGDLTAIGGLIGTAGLLRKTAANTWTLDTTAYGTGTVTSVGLAVPTGFSVSGSPVTGSGNLTLGFAAGYALPTTAKQANWDTAFGWGNHASAGYLLSSTAASTYQPLDADLTAIAALAGTSGLLRKTAADTWSLDTATYLQSGAIGSTVLAYDANLQAFVTAFTLPTADGTSGQVLTTNGAGVISFATPASPEIITTPTGTVYRFTQPTKPIQRSSGVSLGIGDQWKKSDNGTEWFWNGTYWLSTTERIASENVTSINLSSIAVTFLNSSLGAEQLFITRLKRGYWVATADASNYWESTGLAWFFINEATGGNNSTGNIFNSTIRTLTTGDLVETVENVNTLMTSNSTTTAVPVGLTTGWNRVGTPSNITAYAVVYFRQVFL